MDEIPTPQMITGQLLFEASDNISTLYATEVGLQLVHTELVMSFFEVRLPYEKIESDTNLKAKCISRVAISIAKLPDIIQSLQMQMVQMQKIATQADGGK